MSETAKPATVSAPVTQELIDLVVTPRTMRDIPVLGAMFTSLSSFITKISDEDMLILANAFEQSQKTGKLALKLHNPFVETALFNVIQPELKRLIAEAAKEKKAQEEAKAKA